MSAQAGGQPGLTIFSICTPVCNTYTPVQCVQGAQGVQGAAAPVATPITIAGGSCTTMALPSWCCPQGTQEAAAPQGITVFSLCTPVCNTITPVQCFQGAQGAQGAQGTQGAAAPQGLTVFSLCTPVCNTYTPVQCFQGAQGAQGAAAPQGITVFSLCTPVCNTITPVQCFQGAQGAQGAQEAVAPQGITVFSLCTPVCNTVTPVQCFQGAQTAAPANTMATVCTQIGCHTSAPTICPPQQGAAAAPQGLTVFSLCTPVCNTITPVQCFQGAQGAQGTQGAAAPQGITVFSLCTPVCNTITPVNCNQAAQGAQGAQGAQEVAAPQGITVFSLCTPVCNTVTPVQCFQGAQGARGAAAPTNTTATVCTQVGCHQTTLLPGCHTAAPTICPPQQGAAAPQGITVFTLCTPVCNTVTPVQCFQGAQGAQGTAAPAAASITISGGSCATLGLPSWCCFQQGTQEAAAPQGLTVFSLCTPVCNTYTPIRC